ncbi:MAG TPA: hypothetical protein ENO25_06465 [Desulfobacteraceae bacterium]|nr:hypothetical protein [Desulfobacteraceae bacterium]
MTNQIPSHTPLGPELDDDDRIRISEIFQEDIVPRLMMMDARIGNINCDFAGENYKNWVLEFRSARSGLEIVNFEYDEESRSFSLPPRPLTGDVAKNV